jgi:hypothetical protein
MEYDLLIVLLTVFINSIIAAGCLCTCVAIFHLFHCCVWNLFMNWFFTQRSQLLQLFLHTSLQMGSNQSSPFLVKWKTIRYLSDLFPSATAYHNDTSFWHMWYVTKSRVRWAILWFHKNIICWKQTSSKGKMSQLIASFQNEPDHSNAT